jgi:hypothetical protein
MVEEIPPTQSLESMAYRGEIPLPADPSRIVEKFPPLSRRMTHSNVDKFLVSFVHNGVKYLHETKLVAA